MKTRITRIVSIYLSFCCVLLAACGGGTMTSSTPAAGETASPALSPSPSLDPSPSSSPLIIPSPHEVSHLKGNLDIYVNHYKQPFGGKPLDIPTASMETLVCYTENFINHRLGYDYSFYTDRGFTSLAADTLINHHPTQAIRYNQNDTDKESTYAYFLHDLENGMRVFSFYIMKLDKEFSGKDRTLSKDFLDAAPYHYGVIMAKKLSYSDFERLMEGDSMDLVGEIDPVIPVYQRQFDLYDDATVDGWLEDLRLLTSIHLLTDGILKIEYTRDKKGRYWIKTMTYSEDFTLKCYLTEHYPDADAPCYQIDPQDYVD